jgi:hypothetical protein
VIDEGSLLATLAQSSAAVVAIVGGFLVSRLVQLSSEREGLRRQLGRAQDDLQHVTASYNEAHQDRLYGSQESFYDWVIDDLIRVDLATFNRDELLEQNVPRGSSIDEMGPYLDDLIAQVAQVKATVKQYVRHNDLNTLDIDDLSERGLKVPSAQEDVYSRVVDWVKENLPAPRPNAALALSGLTPSWNIPSSGLVNSAIRGAELRRLDESIRDEHDLRSRKAMLEAEVARLGREIGLIGQPAGVTAAIVILATYSVLGIVAPVVVMGLGLKNLAGWLEWLLVGLFVLGLSTVLAYILWYATTLNYPVPFGPRQND